MRSFLKDEKGQSTTAGAIIGAVITFILVMYIMSSTYTPMEKASDTLKGKLNSSVISGVTNLADLPGVAVLLFVLVVIFGIIVMAVRGANF